MNGMFNGIGKLTWKNGDYYEGQFLDDYFHGNGELNLELSRRICKIYETWKR